MLKLKSFWNYLNSTLWFLPTVIVGLSILLAIFLIGLESYRDGRQIFDGLNLFGTGAEEARMMLSTIAGSMMTVVGITFSMTLVTLALTSSQYTSRILRNFMRNKTTQFVIGFFVAIFTYCLVVLCTIRAKDEGDFIPSLAILVAFLSAIAGVIVLIFFIHHVASSIQASNILHTIAEETFDTIESVHPKENNNETVEDEEKSSEPLDNAEWIEVLSKNNGYIQCINVDKLVKIATEHNIVIRTEHKVGSFIVKNTSLVSLKMEAEPKQDLIDLINSAFLLNKQRTIEQDVSFGIRQLVDIALKALSPGINDTTTAVMCLNYLTSIMVNLAKRNFNSSYHYEEKQLRVITQERSFETLLDESFDQIREDGQENVTIILKLIESLSIIASQTNSTPRLEALQKQIRYISDMVKHSIKLLHNISQINTQLNQFNAIFHAQRNKTEA